MRKFLDVQAGIESAIKRRAWLGKAGLGHGVVLGVEYKLDGVTNSRSLREGDSQHGDQCK